MCKYGNTIQVPQECAQTQVSEKRRQRVSQAKEKIQLLHWEEYSDSVEVDITYIIRKRGSDVPEVIMKRRQQDAQAKAAKHSSKEKRQQEAQAMAAKHRSESLQSTRNAVSTWYNQTLNFVALM